MNSLDIDMKRAHYLRQIHFDCIKFIENYKCANDNQHSKHHMRCVIQPIDKNTNLNEYCKAMTRAQREPARKTK